MFSYNVWVSNAINMFYAMFIWVKFRAPAIPENFAYTVLQ